MARRDRVGRQLPTPTIRATRTTRIVSDIAVCDIISTLAIREWTVSTVGPNVAFVLNDKKMYSTQLG